MIQKDDILKSLADKHHVQVRYDDPIFAVSAINEVVLQDYAQTMASTVQKLNEEIASGIRVMLERQQSLIKQEQESVARYGGQLLRDAHIRFERSIDDTINTIRQWHTEVADMKTSAWMAVSVAIVVIIMGACIAAAIIWSR